MSLVKFQNWSFCLVRRKLWCCWYSVLLYLWLSLASSQFQPIFMWFVAISSVLCCCFMVVWSCQLSEFSHNRTSAMPSGLENTVVIWLFYVQNDLTFPFLHFVCFQVSASYSHLQCLFWEASSIRDDRSTQKTLVIMPYENIIIIISWLSQYIFIYILWVFCVIFLSITGFF